MKLKTLDHCRSHSLSDAEVERVKQYMEKNFTWWGYRLKEERMMAWLSDNDSSEEEEEDDDSGD